MDNERKQKILIVDDEPVNIKMLTEALGGRYILIGATTGNDAIECALTNEKPDLILLDVMLPDIDGYEVLKRLKADIKTCDIPVIFTTGSDRHSDEVEGLKLGAADYITKPFSMTTLEARVRTQLEFKRYREHLEQMVFEQSEKNRKTNKRLREEITHRKQIEEQLHLLKTQLHHAQKLEAIGALAAGIVHDFNNILYAILGYSELTVRDLPQDSSIHQHVEQILNGTKRAMALIKQILTFSRETESQYRTMKVQPVLKETIKLMKGAIPSTIEIRHKIDENCGTIFANATQIHQIIMNLCTNAYHAMREKGGVLEIELSQVQIAPPQAAGKDAFPDQERKISEGEVNENIDLKSESYLRLTVKDTGHGMDNSTITKIFDPFFTTKSPGEGTGLGLSTVYEIVNSHKGVIQVDSEPGQGAKFDVFFPIYDPVEPKAAPEDAQNLPILTGNERIMVVEDEEPLARMITLKLEEFGYSVKPFTSSVEALEAFRSAPDSFDILITDQTMPKMTGLQLSEELRRIRPDMPIILCTGFNEFIIDESINPNIRMFMKKPIPGDLLATAVRQIMSQQLLSQQVPQGRNENG